MTDWKLYNNSRWELDVCRQMIAELRASKRFQKSTLKRILVHVVLNSQRPDCCAAHRFQKWGAKLVITLKFPIHRHRVGSLTSLDEIMFQQISKNTCYV